MNRNAYWASFLEGWRQGFDNKAECVTALFMYIVLLLFFSAVYKMMPLHELGVPGLTWQHLFWYFAVAESMTVSSPGFVKFGNRIAEGGLIEMMQRPQHIMPMFVLRQTGEHFCYAVFLLTFAAVTLPVFFGAVMPLTTAYVPFVLISIFMSVTMMETLCYIFGTIEVLGPYSRPLSWVLSKLIFALGGLFFPVSLFPPLIKNIVLMTPFPSIISVPGGMMLMADISQIMSGFMMQVFWLLVLVMVAAFAERKMLRHVMEYGD